MAVARIDSTRLLVAGVDTDEDAKKALQALYDIFAANGLGQATFEIVPGQATRLWVKHKQGVEPDRGMIAGALAGAGDYRLLDDPA